MLTNLLSRTARAVAPIFAVAALSLRTLAGGPDITQVAPAGSFLVVNIPDFAQLRQGFEKSGLGAMWREPGLKSFVERITEDQAKELAAFLDRISAESEDIKPPTGSVGLAFFMAENAERPKAEDEQQPEPPPHMMLIADMGENADAWEDLIEKVLARAQQDKLVTTEEDKYGDIKITVVKPVKDDEGEEEDEDDEEAGAGTARGIMELLTGSADQKRDFYIARSGTTMALCSDLKSMENALDGLGGKHRDAVGDAAVFKDSLAQHPGGEAAYAVFIFEPLIAKFRDEAERNKEAREFAPDVLAIFGTLGLLEFKSMSLGLRVDTQDGLLDVSIGAVVPEKKGLVALFSDPAGPFEPPAFASPDAAGVTRFSFRFSGLFDLAREVVAAMPEDERTAAAAGLDQAANIAKPTLEALGPNVYVVDSYRQPLSAESEQMIFAIDVKDQVTLTNTVSFLIGTFPGMIEPRDFEGNTIYSSEGLPISAGIGFGRLFIGTTAGVENAMRLSGRADAPRLATEPAFREAVRPLGNDAIVYSYVDVEQTLRWTFWSMQNEDKIFEATLDEMELDAETKAEILKDYRAERPKWIDHLPPVEAFTSHIGDTVSDLRATPDGFRGRLLLLRPSEKK